jgi:hypothetical protein
MMGFSSDNLNQSSTYKNQSCSRLPISFGISPVKLQPAKILTITENYENQLSINRGSKLDNNE